MFKDDFKKANDNIHADEELVNKVLALKNQKRRHPFKAYIPAAAAAAVIISASSAALPFMLNNDDSGVISSTTVTTNEKPQQEQSADRFAGRNEAASEKAADNAAAQSPSPAAPAPDTAAVSGPSSAANRSSSPKSAASPAAGGAKKAADDTVPTYVPALPAYSVPSAADGISDVPVEQPSQPEIQEYHAPEYERSTQPEYELGTQPKTEPELSMDRGGGTEDVSEADEAAIVKKNETVMIEPKNERVVLSINSGAYEPISGMRSYSGNFRSAVREEEWNYRDYFDYLGMSLSPAMPDDLRLIGHGSDSVSDEAFLSESFMMPVDEDGIPAFDSKIFAFEGSGERYISIQTSKDTAAAQAYLTDSQLSLSKVGSLYAVLIGTNTDWRGYMIRADVSYIINARGLSEDETKVLLLSLAEN